METEIIHRIATILIIAVIVFHMFGHDNNDNHDE